RAKPTTSPPPTRRRGRAASACAPFCGNGAGRYFAGGRPSRSTRGALSGCGSLARNFPAPLLCTRARASPTPGTSPCASAPAYALGPIELLDGCTIAQEAYLCTGTHDFSSPNLPLQTAPIVVGPHAFVGVRAIILPGVALGRNAVVGAGAVVRRNVGDSQT